MHSFDIHAPRGANRDRRILGRGQGSGRGTTAGKGNKGQQSRSGGKTYLGFEGGQMPLYRRLAHRGFSNYPFKVVNFPVPLSALEEKFNEGDTVTVEALFEKKIARDASKRVKILANGELKKKLKIEHILVSLSAREAILKAGGEVIDAPVKIRRKKGEKKVKTNG